MLLEVVSHAPPAVDAVVLYEVPVGLDTLRNAASAYMAAARRWAERARCVTRDLKGEDSPAYALWCRAIDYDRFWTSTDGAHSDSSVPRLDFYRAWVDAGLGAPGLRIADVIHGRIGHRDVERQWASQSKAPASTDEV